MRLADEGPTAIGAISQRNFASSSSFTICRLASALPPSEGFCVSKPVKATAITIGVEDLARSKRFYGEGLGCEIAQDHPNFVSFDRGDGSSSLALYARDATAQDAVA